MPIEMFQRYRVIDVDTTSHRAADLWTSQVSTKWGAAVPHVERVRGTDILTAAVKMNEFRAMTSSIRLYENSGSGSGQRQRNGREWTMAEERKTLEVSRRIETPAVLIFEILANPQRHVEFDGSGMLRGTVGERPISGVGDTFTMKMHRLGDDYLMLNYVVEFEPDRRIFWEPAPGDPSRAEGNDPAKVGIPPGYRWGYVLIPDGDDATIVTEVFDYGPLPEDLLRDGGSWVNGSNSVRESMAATLERLEKISIE